MKAAKRLAVSVFFVHLLFPVQQASAFDYVIDDLSFYPIPPLSKPAKGVPFTEPTFNVTITRITDAATEAETAGRSCYAGYPKHDIENADGSMLLIESCCKSNVGIWDAGTYQKLRCLPPADYGFYKDSKSPVDPRWDATDPNKLFFIRRMTFNTYNYLDGSSTVLHDFSDEFPEPENIAINLAEEGDGSVDRRYWAFGVTWHADSTWKCSGVVSYDVQQDKVLGVLPRPSGSCGNWVSATPLGKVALGTSPILIYDREFKDPPVSIDASGGVHGDFAINDEGEEVYFHGKNGYWRMEDLKTGQSIELAPKDLGSKMSYHISGNAFGRPGWGLVSTYALGQITPSHWADTSIFLVELTKRTSPPPRIWRIAHTHGADKVTHSYSADPFAKFNTEGTKIFWTSNWDDPEGIRDIYQVDLPQNWHQELSMPLCVEGEQRSCGIDVGPCEMGVQECGLSGTWGPCTGGVAPMEELCGDGIDNDCDGAPDEGCDAGAEEIAQDGGISQEPAPSPVDSGAQPTLPAENRKKEGGVKEPGTSAASADSHPSSWLQGGCAYTAPGSTQGGGGQDLIWMVLLFLGGYAGGSRGRVKGSGSGSHR